MLALWALFACTEDDETTWVQYNGDSDEVTVEVGAETTYVPAGDPAGDCATAAGVDDDTTGDTGTTADTGGTDADTGDTGTSDEVPVVAAVSLTSTTGSVEIGWGCVSPAAGPVGTVHTMRVEVLDAYEADVDRVSVRTDSGDRGKDEYDLDHDSADIGFWMFEIESVGEDDEQRTDTLTFRLWVEESSGDDEE
ncbi:MAG: hypothetical protein ACOZNI_00660 [Myxococcota bacterium]